MATKRSKPSVSKNIVNPIVKFVESQVQLLEPLEPRLLLSVTLATAFEGSDGNTSVETTHDWNQVYQDSLTSPFGNTSGADGALVWKVDPVNSGADDIFTGGGSKDTNSISSWSWTTSQPQDKNDIVNAAAVAYTNPADPSQHHLVYLMMDRYSKNGNSTAGFWLLKSPVTQNANGTFSGAHTVGDVLIVVNFPSTGGAATPVIYTWTGAGLSSGVTPSSSKATAVTNTTTIYTPWAFVDKSGTPNNGHLPGEFIEVAVDLDALFPCNDNCFVNFIAETRSSNSVNSTLSDVVMGNVFDACHTVADLSVTKTDALTIVSPGQEVTYSIVVGNNGPSTATGATVTDLFPPGSLSNVTYTSVAVSGATGNTTSGAGNINDSVTIPFGGTITYIVHGTVIGSAPGFLTNTAVVELPSGMTDPTPGNNTATDTDTIVPPPDLAVTKTDGLSTVVPGQVLTYNVTVTNQAGGNDSQNIVVTDTLDANAMSVLQILNTDGGTLVGNQITWNIPALAAGASQTFTLQVSVNGSVPAGIDLFTNSVTVADDGTHGVDAVPGNNIASDTDMLSATPDIAIAKTDGAAQVTPGQQTTYTLTITNDGNQGASGVTATDTLPANTSFVSASDGGVNNAGVITWNVGSLAVGASVTRTVTVQVDNPLPAGVSTITNTASAADDGSNGADPTPGNNTASDTDTLVATPDIAITKTDGAAQLTPGQQTTYTLTITNDGNQGASGVTATDTLPANTSFVSASDGGVNNAGVITWDIGGLAAGASVTRTVTVQVDNSLPAGVSTITNTASAADDGSNGADPTLANNTATDVDGLNAAPDLAVTKANNVSQALPGELMTYTVTISNQGNIGATGVSATDALPANTSFVSASDGGVDNAGVVTWNIGSLSAGASVTRTVTVQMNNPVAAGVDTITDTASVTDDGTNGTDPNPTNNTATHTDTVVAAPDYTVTKTDGLTTVVPGQTFAYTITVGNVGNQDGTNVVVTDTLDPNAMSALQILDTNGGTLVGNQITWNIPALAAGASQTFTLQVSANTPVPEGIDLFTDSVSVTDDGANGPDGTPENNTASDTDAVALAAEPGSISGQKYEDVNGNGVRDPGEPGMCGRVVFIDVNGNGQLDSGEPTAVTNDNGDYIFPTVAQGTYTVLQAPLDGWIQTQVPAEPVTVGSGQNVTGVDFGDLPKVIHTWSSGTTVVTVYDFLGNVDIDPANIKVKFRRNGGLSSITLGGSQPMEGLGIVINQSDSGTHVETHPQIVDKRKGNPGDVLFIASNTEIWKTRIASNLIGYDIDGLVLGGMTIPNNPLGVGDCEKTAIYAPELDYVTVKKNLTGNVIVTDRDDLARLFNHSIFSFKVGGTMSDAKIKTVGTIMKFTAGQMVNSDIWAGFTPNDLADPLAGGTFTPGVQVRSVRVKGGNAPAFVDSNIVASQVRNVRLQSVDTTNAGLPFGVMADESIRSVVSSSPSFRWLKNGPSDQFIDDFHVIL